MITIRQIDDKELFQLIDLNYKFYLNYKQRYSKFNSTYLLMETLLKDNSLAIGVFKDSTLIGFTLGYSMSDTVFHFTALYVEPQYRLYTKRLYEKSEASLTGKYTSWVCEGFNKEGCRLHTKMGAKVVQIKKDFIVYRKEI